MNLEIYSIWFVRLPHCDFVCLANTNHGFISTLNYCSICIELSKYTSCCSLRRDHTSGLSDVPGESMVKLYCPKCQDVYTPKSSRHHHTDGAYFGTGFPHMLFMVHPEYRPKKPTNQFIPRYFFPVFIYCFPRVNCAVFGCKVPQSWLFKPCESGC